LQSDKQTLAVSELANIDVGLAEGNEGEAQHVTVDAAEPRHFAAAAAAARQVLAAFGQNHLYWRQQVATHHV